MFTVSCWYRSSEATYSFGPFANETLAREFAESLDERKVSNVDIAYHNLPALYGTGEELNS